MCVYQADMSSDRAIRRDEGERLARVSILFTSIKTELIAFNLLLTVLCSVCVFRSTQFLSWRQVPRQGSM